MPAAPTLPSLFDFATIVTGMVEQIAQGFERPGDDDDFHPIMIALPGDGSQPGVFGLPGELLSGQENKDILAEQIMVPIIDATGAKLIAWVMSAWSLEFSGLSQAEAMAAFQVAQEHGLSTHPNRVERVMVTAINSHDWESRLAPILRTAVTPPTLGEWADWKRRGSETGRHVEGRFMDPLQTALRDSSGVPNERKLAVLIDRFGV